MIESTPLTYSKAFLAAFKGFERDLSHLQKFIRSCPDGAIVEMGAGFGRLLPLVENRPAFFVEKDLEMLQILRAESAKYSNVTVIESSAQAIPLNSGSVSGAIFAANSLAEMQPLVFALSEASRLLKVDGLVDIAIQNPEFTGEAPASFRLAESEGSTYTCHIDTFPMNSLGPYSFQTQLLARNRSLEKTFFISQTFPKLDYWIELLPTLNLEVEKISSNWSDSDFSRESSFVLNIRAKKTNPTNADMNENKLRDIYDRMAPNYDAIVKSSNYAVPEWLLTAVQPLNGMSLNLLDLGCGNGWLPELLNSAGIHTNAYGIDFSSAMIEESRKRNIYRGLLVADLVKPLPIIEGHFFDLVSVFGLMEFVPDPLLKINEIHSVIKSGASVFFSFEETQESSTPSGVRQEGLGITKYHYSRAQVENIFAKSKLRLKQIESISGYLSPSSQMQVNYLMVHAEKVF